MAAHHQRWVWVISSAFVILSSLACTLLSLPRAQQEPDRLATRTPLPTFTPTATGQAQILIPPTPTALAVAVAETPLPPPTETPTVPAAPPTEAAVVEPTATETPVPPPPTEPPPAAAAPVVEAPPPTEPPPPPEPAAPAAQHGVVGQITFRDGKNTYAVGEKVFVKIEATNVESGLKSFGILGLTPSSGNFQTSWDNGTIGAGETFRHEDGLAFSAPGTYKLWLSICFSSKEVCQGPDGQWARYEPGLDVIVQ